MSSANRPQSQYPPSYRTMATEGDQAGHHRRQSQQQLLRPVQPGQVPPTGLIGSVVAYPVGADILANEEFHVVLDTHVRRLPEGTRLRIEAVATFSARQEDGVAVEDEPLYRFSIPIEVVTYHQLASPAVSTQVPHMKLCAEVGAGVVVSRHYLPQEPVFLVKAMSIKVQQGANLSNLQLAAGTSLMVLGRSSKPRDKDGAIKPQDTNYMVALARMVLRNGPAVGSLRHSAVTLVAYS